MDQLFVFFKKTHQYISVVVFVIFLSPAIAESLQKPAVMSSLASKVLLTGSAKLKSNAGYVGVGVYGHIIYSADAEKWTQANTPTQALLTNVFFLDENLGWATGHDAVILHTKDGGKNWQLQYEDPIPNGDIPKPLLDVFFQDKNTGYAVGAYGLILKTVNGGEDWVSIDTDALYEKLLNLDMEPEPGFNSVKALGGKILLAGELGTILLYDPAAVDEESTWAVVNSPYVGTFFGLKALSTGELFIYGLRGNVFHSVDLGKHWTKIETSVVANIYDCIELTNGKTIFLGAGGTVLVLKSGDKATQKYPYKRFNTFISGQVISDSELLLFGSSGVSKLQMDWSE
jgi:photosystem II stability/assembly factor-like uncharacterized protein